MPALITLSLQKIKTSHFPRPRNFLLAIQHIPSFERSLDTKRPSRAHLHENSINKQRDQIVRPNFD